MNAHFFICIYTSEDLNGAPIWGALFKYVTDNLVALCIRIIRYADLILQRCIIYDDSNNCLFLNANKSFISFSNTGTCILS